MLKDSGSADLQQAANLQILSLIQKICNLLGYAALNKLTVTSKAKGLALFLFCLMWKSIIIFRCCLTWEIVTAFVGILSTLVAAANWKRRNNYCLKSDGGDTGDSGIYGTLLAHGVPVEVNWSTGNPSLVIQSAPNATHHHSPPHIYFFTFTYLIVSSPFLFFFCNHQRTNFRRNTTDLPRHVCGPEGPGL